jgi:GT2 family glycosyltransferase
LVGRQGDLETKYVAFLNNDLILEPSSLRELIDYMEGDDKIAATNGLIYLGDGRRIYSAGGYATDHWDFDDICRGATEHECPGINKPHYVTYADGAYMLVKAEAIRRNYPDNNPFIDKTYLCLNDVLLILMLWNKGYGVAYVTVRPGLHYANLTTKPAINYYGIRANTALITLLDTRFSWVKSFYLFRRDLSYKVPMLI